MPPISELIVSEVEAGEILELLPAVHAPRRAEQHMARARLRNLHYPLADAPTVADFEALVDLREIRVDQSRRARIQPQPSGQIFRVSVGLRDDPVDEDWWAFGERFHWFGEAPQNVSSGDHLFICAVGRWRSAIVGLHQVVSAGAQRLPDSPDPDRWPFALGVRPLAAILPPNAIRVPGQTGPHNPLPAYVYDEAARPLLYAAVAASLPPPGPETVEQRMQEVDWMEVGDDVVRAVHELASQARFQQVFERALQIGEWSEEELEARAWYTGSQEISHIHSIVKKAIRFEEDLRGRIARDYSNGPYHVVGPYQPPATGFGVDYRPAGDREPVQSDEAPHQVNLDALDAATARHMKLQDRLAKKLRERGIDPRSAAPAQPTFDLAFEHDDHRLVVEVKSGLPVSTQQVRLGVGQVLEYAHRLGEDTVPVLLVEGPPPAPWGELLGLVGVRLLIDGDLDASLDALLHQGD